MIITKYVNLEINKGNIPFYKKKFTDIKIGDIVKVDVDDLSKGSTLNITARCQFCESEKEISFKLYSKQISKNQKFACSKKCAAIRTKDYLLENYNVKNISQLPSIVDKIKKTNLEKYNNEYFFGSDIAIEKIREKMIEKFGVEHAQQSFEIRKKTTETNITKYGSISPLSSETVREKIRSTNLEKYGYEQASKCQEVKEKIISTNIKKYGSNSPLSNEDIKSKSKSKLKLNFGVDSPQKSDEIKLRTKLTNLNLRGVEFPSQSDDVKIKIKESFSKKYTFNHSCKNELFRKNHYIISNDENYLSYKSDGVSLFKCKVQNHIFEIKTDNFFQRKRQGSELCTICNPISKQSSIKEKDLALYIESIYKGQVITSFRDGIEIDIFLPELKLGFEFNGLYWHSEKYKQKNYHLDKTDYFKSQGIRIIHIWSDDWMDKNEIIKSQIKYWLKLTPNKIHARKCYIKQINNSTQFLNKNHIQGSDKSVVKLALFDDNEIVSIMTFNKFEGRKKLEGNQWNLSRFCNKLDHQVNGAASKLLNHFIISYKPSRIISYAERSWSDGNLYNQLGFELVGESEPDYKYVIDGKRIHKQNFKKSKLKINSSISESDFMKDIGYHKIYDCGKLKFERFI
jgi:hypothetical protein